MESGERRVGSREDNGSNMLCSSDDTEVTGCKSDNVLCSSEGAGLMGFRSEDGLVAELPRGPNSCSPRSN